MVSKRERDTRDSGWRSKRYCDGQRQHRPRGRIDAVGDERRKAEDHELAGGEPEREPIFHLDIRRQTHPWSAHAIPPSAARMTRKVT